MPYTIYETRCAAADLKGIAMNRRDLLSKVGAAGVLMASAGAALKTDLVSAATGAESSKLFLPPDRLAPATFDRLPLSWHKERFRTLQGRLEQAGNRGVRGQ